MISFLAAWLTNKNINEIRREKAKQQLLQTMSEIGKKATKRGMTDDILNEILNEQ